jgi:hypothetical protein
MQRPRIDTYFASKGINVYYNTLGHTEELVNAYVSRFDALLQSDSSNRSQNIKQLCYETMWDIKPRTKRTGFEDVLIQDKAFRQRISKHIRDIFYGPTLHVARDIKSTDDYRTLLIESLKKVEKPVLYLSGGVDSEVVARALLETGTKFVPVIFKWTDRSGKIINQYELDFALAFCSKHNLTADVQTLDVESLWETEEFFLFAQDIQIQSTHQLTHAWVVQQVADRYPGATHLFGGEVRFFSSSEKDKPVNVVFLEKVDPPAYNDNFFQSSSGGASNASVTLRYDATSGNYFITRFPSGVTNTGQWTTTPASSYEYQVTGVTVLDSFGAGFTYTPTLPMPSFDAITGNKTICNVESPAFEYVEVNFNISVRDSNLFATVTSNLTMRADGSA